MKEVAPFCFDDIGAIRQKLIGLSNVRKIEAIEYWLSKKFDNIADELPLKHYVCNGVYIRELFIPSGTLLTGKIHLHNHLAAVASGDVSVMCDDGVRRISGYHVFESKAGAKRIGYAHADTLFVTIHKTDKTDIPSIEADLFMDSDLSWVEQSKLFEGALICQQ